MRSSRLEVTIPSAADWLALRSQGTQRTGDVLFHAPSHVFQSPGGGENQLVQTGRGLESLGVGVRPFSPWIDDLREARLLHLFGMSREGLELAKIARSLSIPVVLSPISWYQPRAIAALAGSKVGAIRDLLKWGTKAAFPTSPGWKRALLMAADAILPNSQAEADQLARLFGVDQQRIHVVPNGVEPRFAEACPDLFRTAVEVDGDFVLYVGRIEPRKNVLGLVEAARLADLPLVVIGNAPAGRESYLGDCRERGGSRTVFLDAIEHHDPLLASAYAAARVFALPSWFETPGLAALEAALAGCSLVITPYGCTKEYFGESAIYPRPGNLREIAHALSEAWTKGPDETLIAKILSRYLWTDVARRTAEVYDNLA